jgi:ABC-2 type transport system ATP-binding protein
MISVQNLTKRFGHFTDVDGVSFSVGQGAILGFLGPNGSGKSTVIQLLRGLHPCLAWESAVGSAA